MAKELLPQEEGSQADSPCLGQLQLQDQLVRQTRNSGPQNSKCEDLPVCRRANQMPTGTVVQLLGFSLRRQVAENCNTRMETGDLPAVVTMAMVMNCLAQEYRLPWSKWQCSPYRFPLEGPSDHLSLEAEISATISFIPSWPGHRPAPGQHLSFCYEARLPCCRTRSGRFALQLTLS